MTRIKILPREEMNEDQGSVYDQIGEEGGPRAGPYWAYIRHPKLMRLCQDLGNWFRGSGRSGRERPLAEARQPLGQCAAFKAKYIAEAPRGV